RRAVGVVLSHRGIGQRQAGAGVVEGAAAQSGPAAAVGLVVGQSAGVHGGRGRQQGGNAAAGAAATPLGLVVVEGAAADGDRTDVELTVARRVVVPQSVEDRAARSETCEDPGPAGRIAAAAAGLAMVQIAVADGGRSAQIVRNAGADSGADKST